MNENGEQYAVVAAPQRAVGDWSGSAARGIEARQEREKIVSSVLRKGKDYGRIPGCGEKPALLKPGAERIADSLNLWPDFQSVKTVEDFEKPFVHYQYRCTLRLRGTDLAISSGIGSCNSREDKYAFTAWRDSEAPGDKDEQNRMRNERTGRWRKLHGKWVWQQRESASSAQIFSLVNTIDKMAQKRSMIAATLNLGFSEHFTQDIDDNPQVFQQEPTQEEGRKPPTKPKPEQSSGPHIVEGTIAQVVVKEGQGKKGPWRRVGAEIDGQWYGTFDPAVGDEMLAASEDAALVRVEWKQDGLYKTAVGIERTGPSLEVVDDREPGEEG